MPESANAHDADDCLVECEHPDHAFDGPFDLGWFLLEEFPACREREYDYGPVIL